MRRILRLVLVLSLALPSVAAAQSPSSPPGTSPVLAVVLEGLCTVNATTDADRAACLDVVHRILVPGSGPAPTPAASGYGADLPGVGVTLSSEDKDVTLVEVDWNATDPNSLGKRYVAIRVLYQATQDGASYNPYDWSAVDLDGFEWEQAYFDGNGPTLASSDDLPAGRKAQGWVTFEVPESVHALEIVNSLGFGAGYLRWLVTEPQ